MLLSEIASLSPKTIPVEQILTVCTTLGYDGAVAFNAYTTLANVVAHSHAPASLLSLSGIVTDDISVCVLFRAIAPSSCFTVHLSNV